MAKHWMLQPLRRGCHSLVTAAAPLGRAVETRRYEMRQPQGKRLGELPCETLGIETAQKLQVQEDGCHGATRRHTYAGHQLAKLFCEALFCTFVVLLNSILNSVPSYIPTSKLCIIDCSRVIINRGSLIYQSSDADAALCWLCLFGDGLRGLVLGAQQVAKDRNVRWYDQRLAFLGLCLPCQNPSGSGLSCAAHHSNTPR